MRSSFTESEVEEAALDWLHGLGYQVLHGPEIAPGEPAQERESFQQAVLPRRLHEAIARLNPKLPAQAFEEVFRKVARLDGPTTLQANRAFHRMLVDGVDVEYRKDGKVVSDQARLFSFDDADANDWVAVNQLTMKEGQYERRPDVVLYVNGLPLAVIELKNPADADATTKSAYMQLQTYKQEIGSLFTFNEVLVASDGVEARFGSLTANFDWFLPWRTIEGPEPVPAAVPQLEVLVKGLLRRDRLLGYLRHYVVFEEDRGGIAAKKLAGYHQYWAVERAVVETVRASGEKGDRKCGVVWHTQGSGKSLTMAYFAGRLVLEPALANPTIVVITDRNDLDEQLFGTFSRCHALLRQSPAQAQERGDLKTLLDVASGGVVFMTIQKFLPENRGETQAALSQRSNIIVIADEAHRTQYGFEETMDRKTGEKRYGLAKHMHDVLPNASFIGFTATPLELADKDTRRVFGDYVSVYDIQQAVEDKATVGILYEARMAQLALDETERPKLDEAFEEITEGEEETEKELLKTKWGALEAVVGAEKRVALLARDIVAHFSARQDALRGKAMIVCMSRRICVALYDALVALRPEWHDEDDGQGALKVVMTGQASHETAWQQHIRTPRRRASLAKRFRDPKDPLEVVIVRDMWLTGFDVPCLHTIYVDKPMQGHGLMQAIARVNRVFGDKPGGLMVDYLGLADPLRKAWLNYTRNGGRGDATVDQEEAARLLLDKHDVCASLFHGFDRSRWSGSPEDRLALLRPAADHVLGLERGKERYLQAVAGLSRAFALAMPHEKAVALRSEVSFFQTIRAVLIKTTAREGGKSEEEMDAAIQQLVARAIVPGGVVNILTVTGLGQGRLPILSEEFLAEIRGMPYQHLGIEALRRLLADEIKAHARKNLVQSKAFSERLEASIRTYENRAIESAKVIEELAALARDMREAGRRGEQLGLTDAEVAFYDALETNDSAVKILGDETLRAIARELVATVRKNVSLDWTAKESVRAKLRVMVRRVLRRYDYPPDKEEKAAQTVLAQAEQYGSDWVRDPAAPAAEPPVLAAFRMVKPLARDRYVTCVPLLTLQAAAGGFGPAQAVDHEGWVEPKTTRRLRPGMFVAQVVGKSMEPRIPDGAYCLFASPVEGGRQGRIVLVQHRSIQDPETGGSFTVKRYASTKVQEPGGTWRHASIRLEPINSEFGPIELKAAAEEDVQVVAEMIEVLAE